LLFTLCRIKAPKRRRKQSRVVLILGIRRLGSGFASCSDRQGQCAGLLQHVRQPHVELMQATKRIRKGIGMGLLQNAVLCTLNVAEHVDLLALLIHRIDADTAHCYQRFGVEASPLGVNAVFC
jgi:hypothetical protein